MTPDNTYHHPAKGEECRDCKREYMRLYMREKRAAAAAPRGRRTRPAQRRKPVRAAHR